MADAVAVRHADDQPLANHRPDQNVPANQMPEITTRVLIGPELPHRISNNPAFESPVDLIEEALISSQIENQRVMYTPPEFEHRESSTKLSNHNLYDQPTPSNRIRDETLTQGLIGPILPKNLYSYPELITESTKVGHKI